MTVLPNHFIGKSLQRPLVGNIAYKMVALLLVYHTHRGSSLLELLSDASPDALCTSCHNDYFIFEIQSYLSSLNWNLLFTIAQPSLNILIVIAFWTLEETTNVVCLG